MIEIMVNGESRKLETICTITEFLRTFNIHERMVVVEHNGEIIPRTQFPTTLINAGDNLEIVQMMAGG